MIAMTFAERDVLKRLADRAAHLRLAAKKAGQDHRTYQSRLRNRNAARKLVHEARQ